MDAIGDVIERMRGIEAALDPNDGVAWFNKLYLQTTEEVAAGLDAGRFEDPRFLEALDVTFADLYFDAVKRWDEERARTPRAWAPLFESRDNRTIAPIQFALAGMNAHINRDLAGALAATCKAFDAPPERQSPRHRDYLVVNQILQETEARAKQRISTGWVAEVDERLGQVDDVLALWSIGHARQTAWTNAEMLCALAIVPGADDAFLDAVDGIVGALGRMLLLPRIPL